MKSFGSVAQVKEASVEDLCELPGFGPSLAEKIYETLHQPPAQSD